MKRKIPCKSKIIINEDLNIKNKNETNETTTLSSLETVIKTTPSSLKTVDNIMKNIETNDENNMCNIHFINSKNNGYKCLICNKIFKHSQSLTKHKKNKHINYEEEIKKLNKNSEDIILLKNQIELTKHKLELTEKNIDELKQTNEEYKNIIQTSKSKKSIKKENDEIIKRTSDINNNTTNNTINNTQNNNYTINNNYIVNFGEEDISKLTLENKKEILCSGKQLFPTLISKIYLNNETPEYNCICITNLRSNDMLIMDNGKFITVDKKKTEEEFVTININKINEIIKKSKKKKKEIALTEEQEKKIKEEIMFVYNYDPSGQDDAEDAIKLTPTNIKRYTQIRKDSEMNIYNYKNKILDKLTKKFN